MGPMQQQIDPRLLELLKQQNEQGPGNVSSGDRPQVLKGNIYGGPIGGGGMADQMAGMVPPPDNGTAILGPQQRPPQRRMIR